MSTILSKTETAILVAAAGRPDGLVEIPPATRPSTRERLLGRFGRHGLTTEGVGSHRLTPAGYKAVGLRPPRRARSAGSATEGSAGEEQAGGGRPVTKLVLIQGLLARPEGATLAELIAATGWLPHTTRAALSRLRSAGTTLRKRKRPDGATAYQIEAAAAAAAAAEPAQDAAEPKAPAREKRPARGRRAGQDEVGAAA